ncbi:hypothetical protein [Psychrobacter sp. Cmf 22.2]|uniref:hypothetical protein n=1 Tax=Psychrobacter sp. Cmf 22.2 TaxID=1926478 RepID=UPI000946F215|nr:hypothetical protein [Psychrobacter sp. Cmf 22.2]OLF37128.1 hypothetical protein BTV98_09485 [Psychrobacter sp. Cmf 22.2]
MATDGIIEVPGLILIIMCLLRSAQYVVQSQSKQSRYFWLASVLVFFAVIRRELNYLPELLIPSDFSLLGHSYDWWEDSVLTVIYLLIVGLLIYSWRYLKAVLKDVDVSLYVIVVLLAIIQYMGENAIVFPYAAGGIIEELAETAIYGIALLYLWKFKLVAFENSSVKPNFDTQRKST